MTDRKKKMRLLHSGAILLVVAVLLIGFTYAWFINRNDMATLMEIREPSEIAILGPDGQALESLNLSGNETADGEKVIRKVFCVQSADNYKLEIAHTTNLKGLEFKIYPATKNGTGGSNVTDGGISFSYDSSQAIQGSYINVEAEADNYKYADSTKHEQNYQNYENVQTHAEPVYWLAADTQTANTGTAGETEEIKGKTYYRNYYVCEVTWTEDTKETDIFYILAQGAGQ